MTVLGSPLSQEQWNKYKDPDGRILNPGAVKEVIFRGVRTYGLSMKFFYKLIFYKKSKYNTLH